MTEITIHSISAAQDFFSSLSTFTQDAKIIFRQDKFEVHAECAVPSRLRISFYSNAISAERRVDACFRELNRFNIALRLIANMREETDQVKLFLTDREDFLIYDDGSTKFKIGTINPSMIDQSVAKMSVKDDEYSCKFNVPMDKLKLYFSQAQIVKSDAAKSYFDLNSDGSVSLRLEDKKLSHAGMVAVPVTEKNKEGEPPVVEGVFRPVCLASCTLRSLSKLPGDFITFKFTDCIIIANTVYNQGCYYINTGVSIPEQKAE